jgi:hypothetical protein
VVVEVVFVPEPVDVDVVAGNILVTLKSLLLEVTGMNFNTLPLISIRY